MAKPKTIGLCFAVDCPHLSILLNTSSYTVNSFYESWKITCWLLVDMLYFFIPRSRVQVCTCICVGERSCWNRAQWCNCRLFQSELIDSWLFLTSPPVQLSLTFPDRKLYRKIHVWWYRAEQIWASASFRQRVFMRQTPGHHFSEPSPSGSGNFIVGKAAVWIDSIYFPCMVGFAALQGHKYWKV